LQLCVPGSQIIKKLNHFDWAFLFEELNMTYGIYSDIAAAP
jgi:hypothetical protein